MEKKTFPIVIALVRNEVGEILLAKRDEPELSHAHNRWEFIGGGINFGELPEDAIIREAKEEAGVDIKVIRLLPKILTHVWELDGGDRHQIIMIPYECEIIGGVLSPNKREQIGELKFIHPKDLDNYDYLPNTKETLALLDL
jgi:8-oxo-dGTP diphosphatase